MLCCVVLCGVVLKKLSCEVTSAVVFLTRESLMFCEKTYKKLKYEILTLWLKLRVNNTPTQAKSSWWDTMKTGTCIRITLLAITIFSPTNFAQKFHKPLITKE